MPNWEITIHGRVQGVGFRWFTREGALRYNIAGYVKNLANGSVYVMASGEELALASFLEHLKTGARHARVDDMEILKLDFANNYHDFEIR